MKKLLTRVCIMLIFTIGIWLGGMAVINFLPAQYTDLYNASILDKYERLVNIESPKVILVAGSNFAFGIDSRLIEENLNMEVVNLGHHAAIKPQFLMELSKNNIKEGDIVVLGLEYSAYYGGNSDASTLLSTIENYPFLWRCVDNNDYLTIVKQYYSKYGIGKINKFLNGGSPSEGIYSRSSFNDYGDIDFPKENVVRTEYAKTVSINETLISKEMVDYINEYNKYILSKGGKLYITYPALDEQVIISTRDEISKYAVALESKLDAPIISEISDYIMPSKFFYDTDYHLNNSGTQIRTNKLIEDIKEWGK